MTGACRDAARSIGRLAVAPTGLYVLDAKRYDGLPQLRVEGGLLRP